MGQEELVGVAINEAKNRLGAAQIDLAVRMQLIQSLPLIIQQSVKPMEKIESIRLFQVNGLPAGGGVGAGCGSLRPMHRILGTSRWRR
jgi:uncharacterized membrane protein YqiK